jgi:hypothetical protein
MATYDTDPPTTTVQQDQPQNVAAASTPADDDRFSFEKPQAPVALTPPPQDIPP